MNVVCKAANTNDPYELADRDGVGCLSFLLGSAVVGAGIPISVGAAIASCGFGNPMHRVLRGMGVVVTPAPRSTFVAVAASHPDLAKLFSPSLWIAGWAGALMHLPGAHGGERMSFGKFCSPAILVPRSLIVGEAS